MKAIMCREHGDPSEVCECVDIPNPGNPKPNEINVQMLASAINPADLLAIQGLYPSPPLPAILGVEGVGRIRSIEQR